MSNHPNRRSIKSIAAAYDVRISRQGGQIGLHGFSSNIEAAIREIQARAEKQPKGKYFIERADTGVYLSR